MFPKKSQNYSNMRGAQKRKFSPDVIDVVDDVVLFDEDNVIDLVDENSMCESGVSGDSFVVSDGEPIETMKGYRQNEDHAFFPIVDDNLQELNERAEFNNADDHQQFTWYLGCLFAQMIGARPTEMEQKALLQFEKTPKTIISNQPTSFWHSSEFINYLQAYSRMNITR